MFPEFGRTFLQERAAGTLKPEPLLPKEARTSRRPALRAQRIQYHAARRDLSHSSSPAADTPAKTQRPFYVSVDGVTEEVLVETLSEIEVGGRGNGARAKAKSTAQPEAGKRPRPSHQGHVTTAMPGTIVDVLVEVGKKVKAGDPVLVIEAMKMENEIQAPVSGTVIGVFVAKGDTVTPDEALIEIQAE